jgi:ribokinase
MTVFVAGSLNMDLVATTRRLPSTGETIIGESFRSYPGGKGLNQAISASRSGAQTRMIGAVGNDDYGKILLQTLTDSKVDTSEIQLCDSLSGVALIEVDTKAKNRILVVPEANSLFSADLVDCEIFKNSGANSILLGPLENPFHELEKIFLKGKKEGLKTILNPAPAAEISSTFLRSIDILIPNQHEAEMLSGTKVLDVDTAIAAGRRIVKKGANSVIITLGESGSIYIDGFEEIFQPAFNVDAIDTTAAGDTFCGAFAAALDNNLNIQKAMKFAACAAALSTTKLGAEPSIPNLKEIESFLNSPK